ncbi:MAG: hypothetical protein KatS3mg102_2123 [Planctomycetota bacterium]|nr:MAG: hypothetical protein KatS3mg102_2123 [Planctomycetota bacterium]
MMEQHRDPTPPAPAASVSAPEHRPAPERELLRSFLLASLLSVAVVGALVGMVYARAARDEAIDQGHSHALRVVAHLQAVLAREFGGRSALELLRAGGPERERLDAAIRAAISGLEIRRVYLFDPGGTVVYSTVPGHLGQTVRDYEPLARAVGGAANSILIERGDPLDTGGTEPVPLLETHVPLCDAGGRLQGVFEVYQDASWITAEIREAALRSAAISAASTLLMAGVLLAIFLRAHRLVRARTGELARANAALAELTADLERQVAERSAQLAAQSRLAMLGTLASGIAHEINNPLAAVSSAAEGLLRRLDREAEPLPEDRLREYLEIIRDEVFRAKAITRELLDVARHEPAGQQLVAVNELVRSVAALMRLRRPHPPFELELALAPDDELPPVRSHPGKLRQVIFNVTDNAIDALAPAGGRVVWSTRAANRNGTPEVVLRCTDDGCGLPAEVLQRACEPFFTTKEPGAGTGLGLSISHGIVTSLGGTLEIRSAGPGCGAEVTIRLPAVPTAVPPAPGAAAAERTTAPGHTP